jgi:hypothetical protein
MGDWEPLDINGADYRRLYFIRRSLATMIEFSGALSRMNEITEWRKHVDTLDAEVRDLWKDAVKYFNESHKRLEEIRGDLGGHFKEKAAEFAITHFLPESTGAIEIRHFPARTKSGIRFAFTHEVVAVALRRSLNIEKPTLKEIAAFMNELFVFITTGWKHAVSAVTVIGGQYFVPQFK